MAETRKIIEVDVSSTIQQIVELTDKIEELQVANLNRKKTLQELEKDEKANAAAIQNTKEKIEAQNREIAATQKHRQALRKEVDNSMKQQAGHTAAVDAGKAALEMQVNSIEKAIEANKLLRDAVRKITDAEDESGELRRKMNNQIADNTTYIRNNTDEYTRQKMTIGDYKEQVKLAMVELKNGGFTMQSMGIVSAQFAKTLQMDFAAGWDAVIKGGNAFVGVLRLVKTAIVATGIGALIIALTSLVAVFTKTQKGAEMLSEFLAGIGAVVDVIVDRLAAFGGAIIKIFQGDFVGAANAAKEAISGIGSEIAAEYEMAQKLKHELNQLEKQEVMLNMKRAAGRAEIEEQKRLADDTTKSTKERLAAAEKAYQMENALAMEAVEIGKKKLANMLGQTELTAEANQLIDQMAQGAITADEAIGKLGLSNSQLDDLKEFAQVFEQTAALESEAYSRSKESQNKANQLRKEAAAAAQAARDKELAEVRKAEDELLALVTDARAQQRMEVERSYDRQIEDLQIRLKRETDLTAKAREAINSQIQALEAQKAAELQKLSDEELRKELESKQKTIELKLAAVEEGTAKEYELKLQALQNQMQMELQNAELTEDQKLLIKDKYAKMQADLEKQQAAETAQRQAEEIALRYENELAALQVANTNKLTELQAMGATESQLKQQQYFNELEMLNTSLTQQREMLASMKQREGETLDEFNARRLAAEQQVADTEAQIVQTKASAQTDAYGSIKGAIDAMGESSTAFAKLSKVLALGEIAVNTGKALAAGIAQAQSVPFPANLAAIATTVATILANIATATKTVKAAKFATGGTVTGEGTATSDSIPAMLSNGESVLTAAATSMFAPVLSAFNQIGGGVPIQATETASSAAGEQMLARAFMQGAASLPAPVVSVVDINAGQQRVAQIESVTNI